MSVMAIEVKQKTSTSGLISNAALTLRGRECLQNHNQQTIGDNQLHIEMQFQYCAVYKSQI